LDVIYLIILMCVIIFGVVKHVDQALVFGIIMYVMQAASMTRNQVLDHVK
jgi:hypothetical protein